MHIRNIKLFITIGACCVSAAVFSQKKPGQVFRDCPTCPEMVRVPAGTFMMGSPDKETGRDVMEGPQRKVAIKAFAIGKFHITRGDWERFVAATNRPLANGCAWSGLPGAKPWQLNPAASWKQLGFPQDSTHPAVCISFFDAIAYTEWLSKMTGFRYRLPSEAEWEYAARAGTITAFPWTTSGTLTHEMANYGADSGWTGLAKGKDAWMATSPVGAFAPNAFGLYDMPGNVMQFTADYFSSSYMGLPTDGAPFKSDSSADRRMIRGGDWGDPPRMLRSAFRNWVPTKGVTLADYRSAGLGLRVVREL